MLKITPYAIQLSSTYNGDSGSSIPIYRHGPASLELHGYQYIVEFDHSLGDVPSLEVDGLPIEGCNSSISIYAWDRNSHQVLSLESSDGESLVGLFYLTYKGDRTPYLSVNISTDSLHSALERSFSSIQSIYVNEVFHEFHRRSWTISLNSADLSLERLTVSPMNTKLIAKVYTTCPIASGDSTEFSASSQAGRKGQELLVTLSGPRVRGEVTYDCDGVYFVSYRTPRVGAYQLKVMSLVSQGLIGEYFNNRWLYGDPFTRVDASVDFSWSDDYAITPTGRDFVSARWSGFLRPLYNEIYTFITKVNSKRRSSTMDQ